MARSGTHGLCDAAQVATLPLYSLARLAGTASGPADASPHRHRFSDAPSLPVERNTRMLVTVPRCLSNASHARPTVTLAERRIELPRVAKCRSQEAHEALRLRGDIGVPDALALQAQPLLHTSGV